MPESGGGTIITFQKFPRFAIIGIAIAVFFLTVTSYGLLSTFRAIPLSETISVVNVGVYSDSGCTQNCTSLNVGTLSPGGTVTQTIYIKNPGTVPETLSMTVSNWNPTGANSSVSLSWDQQNLVLSAGQSVKAKLTLTVASTVGNLTNFSCDITFTGSQ
jgi:hypothetical protein